MSQSVHNQLLVTVVIPSLNRAHLLAPTLKSILSQDYPHLECIVVDGGSTDGTLEILKEYGDRITWVSEPDEGHADAINKGWEMGRGAILAWLNADDIWEVPGAVSRAVAYLAEHPEVDVLYGDCGRIDAQGGPIGMTYLHDWDLTYAVEWNDHCIPQPASFIRRRILEKVGFLDKNFYVMDKELWFRIGIVGRIQYVPMLLAHSRDVPGKVQNGRMMARDCVQVIEKFYALPQVPPRLRQRKKRALSNAYLRGIDYAGEYGPHWDLILRYAGRALVSDPSNVVEVMRRLKQVIASRLGDQNLVRKALTASYWQNSLHRIIARGK